MAALPAETLAHCIGLPLPRALFAPPSVMPGTASIPRSRLRVAVLAVRVVAGLSTSMPSSVFPFARLRVSTFSVCPGSTRIPSPSLAISALLEMRLRSDGSPCSR
jgi:hypothetical protein